MFQHPKLRKGFTLIELAIVLTVAGLLFVGLWRLLAGGNQQVRDQSAASQQTQLISATKAYLASSGGQTNVLEGAAIGGSYGTVQLALPAAGTTCNSAGTIAQQFACYLPAGFNAGTVNSYGQTYWIEVLKDSTVAGSAPSTYSFMILTVGGDTIPDTSGGRVSAAIGGDGGFIYGTPVCNPANTTWACGAYGTWSVSVTAPGAANGGYNIPVANVAVGHIASRTYVSPTANNNYSWLARVVMPGDSGPPPDYYWNTMQTDLYMGGTSAAGGSVGNIYMYPTAVAAAQIPGNSAVSGNIFMAAPGATTGGGTVFLEGGKIDDTTDTNNTGSIKMSATGPLLTGFGFIVLSPQCTNDPQLANGAVNSLGMTKVNGCEPGIQVNGDENIEGMMQAYDFYAQTFIYQGSDIRFKTNIHPIDDPLGSVMKLKPVAYTLKSSGKASLGVIAQDVEKIYPELVSDSNGTKAVAYDGLIAPLIGAVQELKKENDQLRSELRTQMARQQKLEDELNRNKSP